MTRRRPARPFTAVRIEVVSSAGDSRIRDLILEHYVLGRNHPIARRVLAELRAARRRAQAAELRDVDRAARPITKPPTNEGD